MFYAENKKQINPFAFTCMKASQPEAYPHIQDSDSSYDTIGIGNNFENALNTVSNIMNCPETNEHMLSPELSNTSNTISDRFGYDLYNYKNSCSSFEQHQPAL